MRVRRLCSRFVTSHLPEVLQNAQVTVSVIHRNHLRLSRIIYHLAHVLDVPFIVFYTWHHGGRTISRSSRAQPYGQGRDAYCTRRISREVGGSSEDLPHTLAAQAELRAHCGAQQVTGVSSHIKRRLKLSTDISLPLHALLKQFSESNGNLLKQFNTIYIQQGLKRLPTVEGIAILQELLQIRTPPTSVFDSQATDGKLWSLAGAALLELL